jgi:glycosyltransferase involved in cell wall biosynthesis
LNQKGLVFDLVNVFTNKKNAKVLFIQPTYAKYRRPLFERFLANFPTTLFFMEVAPPILRDNFFPQFSGLQEAGSKEISKNLRFGFAFYLANQYIRLLALLISNNYDVIVTSISLSPQTLMSLIISRIRAKKCILWIEEWQQSKSKFFVSKSPFLDARYFLKKQVLKNVDAIVVEGKPQWKYAKCFGVPNEKLFFSNHCSLDYSQVKDLNLRQEFNLGNNLIILYVGRIAESKGIDVLIKAFSKIEQERKDTYLVLCGSGSYRSIFEAFIHKLRLKHVLFLGNVLGDAIASCYKMADVFVLPSCARPFGEGWGLVVNEAMSVGLPIITTDAVGAAEDLVKNGLNGYVVRNGDVPELYLALTTILNNTILRKTMGKNSQRLFKEFNNFDQMFNGFKQSIEYSMRSSVFKVQLKH